MVDVFKNNRVVITLLLFVFICSCSSTYLSKYEKSNKLFRNGGYTEYTNDSIKFSRTLYANNLFEERCRLDSATYLLNRLDNKTYRESKRLIKPYIKVGKENFLFRLCDWKFPSTWVTYYTPNKKSIKEDLIIFDSIKKYYLSISPQDDMLFITINLIAKESKSRFSLHRELFESFYYEKTRFGDKYKKFEPENIVDLLFAVYEGGNYIAPLNIIRDGRIRDDNLRRNKSQYLQNAAIFTSFVQNNIYFDKAKEEFNHFLYGGKTKPLNAICFDENALDYIKDKFKNKQIVMLNEQHYLPNHRYLANLLLKDLYKNGFRYLAVEGVSSDSLINERGYPVQSSGIYTREPNYGNFIRNAIEMGFEIVTYEARNSKGWKDRETTQAKNIYNKVLKDKPSSKIFVYVGGSHNSKQNKGNNSAMAYYLNELTGIDILSISQLYSEPYIPQMEEHYLAVQIDSSMIERYDIQICNNLKEKDYKVNPNIESVKTEINLSPIIKDYVKKYTSKFMFSIFIKEEFDKENFEAVPIVNYLIKKGDESYMMYLPRGRYLVIERHSEIINQYEIEVK